MRSPSRPLPAAVERWVRRATALRWADALAAWLALWVVLVFLVVSQAGAALAVSALILVGLAALLQPVRTRWRPVTALVGAALARRLRPGARAWYIRSGQAEPVLVTARRGTRIVIAQPGSALEGLEVRPTRVLLVPDERG